MMRSSGAFVTVLYTLSCINAGVSVNVHTTEKIILDSILGKDYDVRIRPSGSNNENTSEPVKAKVNMQLRSISSIDDVKMEFSTQILMRVYWDDSRLQYPETEDIPYLVLTDPDKIWKPDVFFTNEKRSHFHSTIMPNVLIRIKPNGNIMYSVRISLTLSCSMDLSYFPLDTQICSIKIGSYGWTTKDLRIQWTDENQIEIPDELQLPRFTLHKSYIKSCTHRTITGEYTCAQVNLVFKRDVSYYMLRIYIPCILLVIVSWINFWIDPLAAPARVSLTVTTLLTITATIAGINSTLPPVSYVKAIDVWFMVCLFFAFGSLVEYALINYSLRREKVVKKQMDVNLGQEEGQERVRFVQLGKWWYLNVPSKRIDIISRYAFPIMFLVFNMIYWTVCYLSYDLDEDVD